VAEIGTPETFFLNVHFSRPPLVRLCPFLSPPAGGGFELDVPVFLFFLFSSFRRIFLVFHGNFTRPKGVRFVSPFLLIGRDGTLLFFFFSFFFSP